MLSLYSPPTQPPSLVHPFVALSFTYKYGIIHADGSDDWEAGEDREAMMEGCVSLASPCVFVPCMYTGLQDVRGGKGRRFAWRFRCALSGKREC